MRSAPAIAVFAAFAVLSVLAVRAQGPDDALPDVLSTKHAKAEPGTASTVDVSDFSMVLTYHGETDKPLYSLVLTVGPTSIQQNPFVLHHTVSEEQAKKIVNDLTSSGFFQHAPVMNKHDNPDLGPQYLLRVRHGQNRYQESLHWGMETNLRLRSIRRSLEGDAAQSMDRLLDRLTGHRKLWESGEIHHGLKTTLSSDRTTFVAGEPISVRVELANIGKRTQTHPNHPFIHDRVSFVVTDDNGRRLPFVSWPAGLPESKADIPPSTTKVIEQCDLSEYYYLRRPGRYHVTFRGFGLPSSNALHFDVSPAGEAESAGDPMGKLLPQVAGKWTPVGSPNLSDRIRPGRNRQEAPGWHFGFPLTRRGFKGSKAVVWLWLTNEAVEASIPPSEDFGLQSEYAGKVSQWHMYLHAPPEALEIWPSAREDIKAALATEKTNTDTDQNAPDAVGNNRWGEERAGVRIRLAARKRTFSSGGSIRIRLEAENIGDVSRSFMPPTPYNQSLVVVDGEGQPAPYLGDLLQVTLTRQTLASGQVKQLTSFDLSTLYYLRRPGKYSVTSPGVTMLLSDDENPELRITGPPSPPLEFEVVTDGAVSDGDPIGRLLPVVRERWWLSGSGRMVKLHPGSNRRGANGCEIKFLYNPTGLKEDAGHVWLWLTENAAVEQPATKAWPPESESLGKVDRWHLYLHADNNARAAWPSVREDVVKALTSVEDETRQPLRTEP